MKKVLKELNKLRLLTDDNTLECEIDTAIQLINKNIKLEREFNELFNHAPKNTNNIVKSSINTDDIHF